jgi:DNA-binding CsgD family transcriptional regulator
MASNVVEVVVTHDMLVPGELTDEFLDEISSALVHFGRPQAGVGFVSLAHLAQRLPGAAAVTVDYKQAHRLAAPLVVVRLRAAVEPNPAWAVLTPREHEVARGMARGLPNKVIARQLGLSVGTVKDYVHRILTKTGHASRTSLAAAGMPTGMGSAS